MRKRSDTERLPLLGRWVEMVSATDYQTHLVPTAVFSDALTARTGRYLAACGHYVLACSLFTPPGPLCRLCSAIP